MSDKNCVKVLKLLNKFYENSNYFIEENAISQICNLDKYQLKTILNFLVSNGYVEQNKNCKSLNVYHSTIIGKNYFSNKHKEFIKLIFNSIICLIIVSFITTLLTLLLV